VDLNIVSRPAPKALRRGSHPDPFACSLYACAPYRGCGHACAYCDGRAERYYVEGDFERDIVYRPNLPELLGAELSTMADRGAVSLGSGVTDCYQGLEARLGLSGACAAVLAARGWPAVVHTKSDLILRDEESWAAVAARSACLVMVTVTTMDEAVRSAFEPGAPPSGRRMEIVRRLTARGCRVGVLAMPLLPGIGDSPQAFGAILGAAKEAGAVCVMPGGLTLRPGRQKEHFLGALDGFDPGLSAFYRALYAEERPSGASSYAYRAGRQASWAALLSEAGMPSLIPHAVHKRLLSPPDSLFILFNHMAELYERRGVDARALRASLGRYAVWLSGIRADLRRSRAKPAEPEAGLFSLDDEPDAGPMARLARRAVDSGELSRVLDNAKLFQFARKVLVDAQVFDYLSLALS
jgi:DNA repair photolyase